MQASQIPTKMPVAWGAGAGNSFIRTIPTNSQIGITNGAASFTDGFPPDCFTAIAAGGVPPFGQDANGILNIITLWLQWVQAGGGVPTYDSSFQSAIGGYPKGCVVGSATNVGVIWISTADNNTTNPDTGGAGWVNAIGSLLGTNNEWTGTNKFDKQVSCVPVNLGNSGILTVSPNFSTGVNFYLTATGNFTLGTPTSVAPGQAGAIEIIQDATGGRVITYSSAWKFPQGFKPPLSTAANAKDILSYYVDHASLLNAVLNPAFA